MPVDGLAVPWRMAQIVFVYDSARIRNPADMPRSAPALLDWAKQHPGRLTHPSVSNFLGSTFLKQALYRPGCPTRSVLQQPATDANFAAVTAPLWAWYDQLQPALWRQGRQFPENGPAQRQLLNDGEIDITLSFNPVGGRGVGRKPACCQPRVRTFGWRKGTIGNTSFVAIPYNAAHKEGALVVANFLLEPETQARAQDIRQMGNLNVLDLDKLSAAQRRAVRHSWPTSPALPTRGRAGRAAARAASVVDDAHRRGMAEALHALSGIAAAPRARPPWALRLAPALTLAAFVLPIAAGLVGTLLPAFGWLPALGGATSASAPWRALRERRGSPPRCG